MSWFEMACLVKAGKNPYRRYICSMSKKHWVLGKERGSTQSGHWGHVIPSIYDIGTQRLFYFFLSPGWGHLHYPST
jgi:hypothetical protein